MDCLYQMLGLLSSSSEVAAWKLKSLGASEQETGSRPLTGVRGQGWDLGETQLVEWLFSRHEVMG